MALPSGADAYIGYAEEATFGEYVAPTRLLEFNDETLEATDEPIESAGIRTGARLLRTNRFARNTKGAGGDVTHEVTTRGFALLLSHCLGKVETTQPDGAENTRVHTITLGELTGKSLSIFKAVPDVSGNYLYHAYPGAKVASWELAMAVDEVLTLKLTFDAVDETYPDTPPANPSTLYPVSDELFYFMGAEVTVNGLHLPVTSFTLSGENNLKVDRYGLRMSGLKREQVQQGRPEVSGTLDMELDGTTVRELWRNGTIFPLVATFRAATPIEGDFYPTLVVTATACRADGESPKVSGPELVTQSVPFKVLDDGVSEPLTITYQSADTTP